MEPALGGEELDEVVVEPALEGDELDEVAEEGESAVAEGVGRASATGSLSAMLKSPMAMKMRRRASWRAQAALPVQRVLMTGSACGGRA